MSKLPFLLFVLVATAGCNPRNKSGQSVKFQQYFVEGEQLYISHCSNCHQKSGKGLGLLYPPLDQSDFMGQHFAEVVCLIKNGKNGEIAVNGKTYNQPMPGIPTLTNLEIAEIATYIYNSWTHERGIIDVKETTKILQECGGD
ncbi:MAG: cytochrome c [Cyclobacteriaceae bacterium]|nr:cytochrome c [Cyclobacteriaceae bacterium]MCB0500229.1 cytochrome c [Cyclobacteriaceae bacterium]MCB9237294.1 cytochrome c [Flammeovirgaceae bacterium]MCO5271004.1 cytochrome c [Cyclobacteriaceae bacterium]MCW5903381.1 cytochrome c [Cyclobacteriaceae bacterium]